MIEFTAAGSPRVVSRAIEAYATAQGSVSAIVVPWESDDAALRMAVTSMKTDGWAIEHINLGTIILSDAGHDRTHVAFAPGAPDHEDRQKLFAFFDRFAAKVSTQFALTS